MSRRCQVASFAVFYCVAVVIYLVGFASPYWIQKSVLGASTNAGLFAACGSYAGFSSCTTFTALNEGSGELFNAAKWLCVTATVLCLIAGLCVIAWAATSQQNIGKAGNGVGILAGLCAITGVILYGFSIEEVPSGWAYYFTAIGGVWIVVQCSAGLCMTGPGEADRQATNAQMSSYPDSKLTSIVIQPPPYETKNLYDAPPTYLPPQ